VLPDLMTYIFREQNSFTEMIAPVFFDAEVILFSSACKKVQSLFVFRRLTQYRDSIVSPLGEKVRQPFSSRQSGTPVLSRSGKPSTLNRK
jgi:hypothetical protein